MIEREFKFRMWVKGRMAYPPSAYTFPDNLFSMLNAYCVIDAPVWMQYTGLKDKNGKEIYEWDIITKKYVKTRKVVHWDDDFTGFSPFTSDITEIPGFPAYASEEIEVIGNIYENPELVS